MFIWKKITDRFKKQENSDSVENELNHAEEAINATGEGLDWNMANTTASNWERKYGEEVIKRVYGKTYKGVSELIAQYYEKSMSVGELSKALEQWYSPSEAETIAITETTRASSESDMAEIEQLEKETGYGMIPTWLTANDDLVCDICGPRNNQPIVGRDIPPAHPRCRCTIRMERPKQEKSKNN